jgi:Zn-dependent protease
MDASTGNIIVEGLITYLGLIILLTFHEFGHAWMGMRCGDHTAHSQGRVSLNPLVHIDPVGTVLLPLIMIFASPGIGRFLVGWAKPVPFNPANLNNRRRDEMLIAMAGPAMNVLLAIVLVGLARAAVLLGSEDATELLLRMAALSLVLCFFNLIPIPPLDGSHVMRNLTGMTEQTYFNLSRFGFIAIILILQIPLVREGLGVAVSLTLGLMGWCFAFPAGWGF